jgi:lipopolysaccharide export system permease protein
MSILSRYLLLQNLKLIFLCMLLGIVVYLLSDVFDRLDDFIEAGLGTATILEYFMSKIPLILSQIMPAVFLIAMVVQMGLLERSRELLALQTGGLSWARMAVFFIIYGVLWSLLQLGFSQYFGVVGLQTSSRIWAEQVRSRTLDKDTVNNVWFRSGEYILHFSHASISHAQGQDIQVYSMSEDHQKLSWIASAQSFQVQKDHWMLNNATVLVPGSFTTSQDNNLRLFIKHDLKTFTVLRPKTDPAQLPLWDLGKAIGSLEKAGSNVEGLLTAWHAKWSYAFAILTMSLLALAVSSFGFSIYLSIGASLLATFVFYGFYVIGNTMGQGGLVPPMVGAWMGNGLFMLAAISRLMWVSSKH